MRSIFAGVSKASIEKARKAFQVKDSGQRELFPTRMQRDTGNKTRYDLVFDGPMFARWAEQLTKGAKKYDARNWMKAATPEEMERFRQSTVRHFVQWLNGNTDEDHAAAVYFNINGYEYVKQRIADEHLRGLLQPGDNR